MKTSTGFDWNAFQRTQPWDGDKVENADSKVRDLLMDHRTIPRLVCADGFSMSVQASEFHYCDPRVSRFPEYRSVEVGFPSERQDELMEWAEDADKPTDTVYGWVPVEVINALIDKHGGLAQ